MRLRRRGWGLALWGAAAWGAAFNPQGTTLTVTTANLQATFDRGGVVAITNVLTAESYLRAPSSSLQVDLPLTQPPPSSLTPTGSWSMNQAGTSATLSLSDGNRTVTVAISVDSATQQIVVDLDGGAKQGGVEMLKWGVTGFDLSTGEFIVPGHGGLVINSASFSAAGNYSFYHAEWESPFLLFQGKLGGVNIYSTDTNALCKNLIVSADFGQTANASVQTEAPGPWKNATEAGPIEFRLGAYSGDWQSGARIYRDWHNSVAAPTPLTGGRAWASNIRTVIEYQDRVPYNSSTLDALAAQVNPAQTLLYLVSWRTNGYDVGYPDYSWDSSVPAFITHAHALGFHVMLHTDALGVAPSSPDFPGVQQYQLRDALNLAPQGWNWDKPVSTPNRYALINPGASAYRQLFLSRVTPAIQTLHPDAIHLDFSASFNDGNGLIEGKSFNQGFAQLEQDLLTAFPGLVLGVEELFDATAPRASFSQPLFWSSMGMSAAATPPAPVAAYALPNVTRYSHLGTINADTPGFLANLSQYEGQAVLPTVHTEIADYTQPDIARYMSVVSAFETFNLAPAWDTNWNGAVIKYQGNGTTTAALTETGRLVQLTLQQQSGSNVLYTRAHGVNQVDSPLTVPNWPAFNGTVTLGLDPADQYWLDNSAKPSDQPHITSLPSGARLGLGASTLVASPFSYFTILPPAAQSGYDFFANLWQANAGVTYHGVDFPLASGATANLQAITAGGVSRQGVFCQPPWMAQIGGEVFFEYNVTIPSGGAQLFFAAGIADFEGGKRQGPMTFRVEINGAILWQQDISTGAWQSGSIDLTAFAGLTVRIRFVSNPGPGGNPSFGGGAFSALQMLSSSAETLNGIAIAVPQNIASSNIVTTGGTAVSNGGIVTVNNLPSGGTILLFTGQPSQTIASGDTLMNTPLTLAQGSNSQLAMVGPPVYAGTGAIGQVTSGGVAKQALNAFGPPDGQTILSWLVQLPPAPLSFSFSAGFWDNVGPPFSQGYQMLVRINGMVLWQHNINVPSSWQPGSIDLSPWAGQTVLMELITDTLGPNTDDFTSWGEMAFSQAAGAACTASIPSASQSINASAGGSSTSIPVTIGFGCDWATYSSADWISVTPASSSTGGSATITVSLNVGPQRRNRVTVAGNVVNVTQAAATPQTGPEITLVSAIAGGAQLTASNIWLAIYGANLSATARPWQDSDFVNGQMPTHLDAVSVTVNGKPAFVEYVSSMQVNILTPIDTATGAVEIIVTSGGLTSNTAWVPMQASAPGFFQFSGTQYVAATHALGDLLGPTSLYPGFTTPAKPNDIVTIYGGGFGQTTPAIANGPLAQNGNLLPLPVFTISNLPAQVLFAGVTGGGLYQFNIVIPPDAPDGDDSIMATYGGTSTQAGALIAVQH